MKKTILFLFLLIIEFSYSQTFPILRTISFNDAHTDTYWLKKGDYIKDDQNTLDKYVGTWVYSNDNTVFTIRLNRINAFLIPEVEPGELYFYNDVIVIRYKLLINNNVVFDNLNDPLVNVLNPDDAITSLSHTETNNYLNGVFKDIANNVFVSRCEITKLINAIGQPQKIYFKLYPNHSRRMNPPSFYQGMTTMYSMPSNIELTKID